MFDFDIKGKGHKTTYPLKLLSNVFPVSWLLASILVFVPKAEATRKEACTMLYSQGGSHTWPQMLSSGRIVLQRLKLIKPQCLHYCITHLGETYTETSLPCQGIYTTLLLTTAKHLQIQTIQHIIPLYLVIK